jgi:hypothetical protein
MNAAQSVTATFAQTQYTLNVGVAGSGTVTSSPAGVSCPSVCTMNYASGTPVMLTATPIGGATFNGWGGACSGNGSCLVTMNSLESVTAMFSSSGGGPSSQTFVSATLGSDSNPCTRTSPCLTFAAALAQTTAGGEIGVLDPGDFGPVTITRAISIFNDTVGVAGTISSSGTSGIVVSAGANDLVKLRGLIFDGLNSSVSGIQINSALRVTIQNCVIQEFGPSAAGINVTPSNSMTLKIQDSTIINNNNIGVNIKPSGGATVYASIDRTRIDNNAGDGVHADGTGGGSVLLALSDSSMSVNVGNGLVVLSGPGNAKATAIRDSFGTNGGAGIKADQSGGGSAAATVGSSMFADDLGGAISLVGGGTVYTLSNNELSGPPGNSPTPLSPL